MNWKLVSAGLLGAAVAWEAMYLFPLESSAQHDYHTASLVCFSLASAIYLAWRHSSAEHLKSFNQTWEMLQTTEAVAKELDAERDALRQRLAVIDGWGDAEITVAAVPADQQDATPTLAQYNAASRMLDRVKAALAAVGGEK